jgi:GDPmannose 4,6-dehydratase
MKKTAFITGISGQDGSYLAEYLDDLGYGVYGIIRRNSIAEHQDSRIKNLKGKVTVEYGDVLDIGSLDRILNKLKPTEIYNLASQSHVRISFDIPQWTTNVNSIGVLNILESMRLHSPSSRFYQASSSEMFGNSVDKDGFQRETTAMMPVSPYGCAKLYSYHITRNYRKSYKLFASNGILFNHESERRGSNFVTSKVVKTAVEIKMGISSILEMGNLDSYRDWGNAKDYVRSMNMIINHSEPDDFVVSSMESRSVRDMCDYVFSRLGIKYSDFVVQSEVYLRPEELKFLKGDSSKIRNTLGWAPKYDFYSTMNEIIDFWCKIYGLTLL